MVVEDMWATEATQLLGPTQEIGATHFTNSNSSLIILKSKWVLSPRFYTIFKDCTVHRGFSGHKNVLDLATLQYQDYNATGIWK